MSHNTPTDIYEFKSSPQLLTKIEIKQFEPELMRSQLAAQLRATPNFFSGINAIIDIAALEVACTQTFEQLVKVLSEFKINVLGAHFGDRHQTLSEQLNVPIFASVKSNGTQSQPTNVHQSNPATPIKIIKTPVRSGQQVYAKGGDLVILSSVSTGAEVMADGNIHVYGCLSGKALAGVCGATEARIFCTELNAELVAIAGLYKTLENQSFLPNCTKQIKAQDNEIIIEYL